MNIGSLIYQILDELMSSLAKFSGSQETFSFFYRLNILSFEFIEAEAIFTVLLWLIPCKFNEAIPGKFLNDADGENLNMSDYLLNWGLTVGIWVINPAFKLIRLSATLFTTWSMIVDVSYK